MVLARVMIEALLNTARQLSDSTEKLLQDVLAQL